MLIGSRMPRGSAGLSNEFRIRRDNIDAVRLDAHHFFGQAYWHRSDPLQQLGQQCLLRGIEMLHHDVG
jgi:hypothetical protein